MSRPTMITLQKIPVDLLLHIGTYLKDIDSYTRDIDGVTLAAILKDYEMLEHYLQKYAPSDISRTVAMAGSLKALKWVIKKGCPMNENTCRAAADSENLEMLQWLHRKGCPWNEAICVAASIGNLEMLKWAIDHGCPELINNKYYDICKNRLQQ
jgi:hypothetical protein